MTVSTYKRSFIRFSTNKFSILRQQDNVVYMDAFNIVISIIAVILFASMYFFFVSLHFSKLVKLVETFYFLHDRKVC